MVASTRGRLVATTEGKKMGWSLWCCSALATSDEKMEIRGELNSKLVDLLTTPAFAT